MPRHYFYSCPNCDDALILANSYELSRACSECGAQLQYIGYRDGTNDSVKLGTALQYHYRCANCGRESMDATYMDEIECVCSVGVQKYAGWCNTDGQYWAYAAQYGVHCTYSPENEKWWWWHAESDSWIELGKNPPEHGAVAAAVAEVAQVFPESPAGVAECGAALKQHGIGGEKAPRIAKQIIESYVNGGERVEAWKILAQWNRSKLGAPISIQEVGLKPEDDPSLAAESSSSAESTSPAAPKPITYNGREHSVKVFSEDGGYHSILEPTSTDTPMVSGRDNTTILVRVPKDAGAPSCVAGFQMGLELQRQGFTIPRVYNSGTLARDGFYIVERVPRAFDPNNDRHRAQVRYFLAQIARSGTGPDFRPDNIRFRDDGRLVLIDFSENAGVEGNRDDPNDFAALIEDFARQFAGRDERLYSDLCSNIPSSFLELMAKAVQPWDQ